MANLIADRIALKKLVEEYETHTDESRELRYSGGWFYGAQYLGKDYDKASHTLEVWIFHCEYH